MKQLFCYLFILFGVFNWGYAQSYNTIISDSLINHFISWEIDVSEKNSEDQKIWKKRINRKILHWENALIGIIGSAKKPNTFENQFEQMTSKDPELFKALLSVEDVEYLKDQFENSNKNIEWQIKTDRGKLKINPKNNFYTYSIPLFNQDKTVAILYKEFYCGSLCAYGHINVYKKEQGNWKLYKKILCWMS